MYCPIGLGSRSVFLGKEGEEDEEENKGGEEGESGQFEDGVGAAGEVFAETAAELSCERVLTVASIPRAISRTSP